MPNFSRPPRSHVLFFYHTYHRSLTPHRAHARAREKNVEYRVNFPTTQRESRTRAACSREREIDGPPLVSPFFSPPRATTVSARASPSRESSAAPYLRAIAARSHPSSLLLSLAAFAVRGHFSSQLFLVLSPPLSLSLSPLVWLFELA